jgi:hypothetical protein
MKPNTSPINKDIQNNLYDYLLSAPLFNLTPIDDSTNEEHNLISLSWCNEIITRILATHIGHGVEIRFFVIPIFIAVDGRNINFNSTQVESIIEKLQEYNFYVRNNSVTEKILEFRGYYKIDYLHSSEAKDFALLILKANDNARSISQTREILGETYNITMIYTLYQLEKDERKKIKYNNIGYNSLSKNQKDAITTYLRNVCTQGASKLEQNHRLHRGEAIAQVMARNLCHNIGSHVFSNLIDKNVYTDLENIINKQQTYCPQRNENGEFINKQDNDYQLAYFNQYLKSRMDYLSEVTFGISNMLTTKKIYSDVFLELDRVRLLLNNISGISNFEYTIKFKYKSENNEYELSSTKDIYAAFPSDVIGCQAFYNIIENVIRNTAKYANKPLEETTFTIIIKDIPDKETNLSDDYQQYYCFEIDDGISIDGIRDRNIELSEQAKIEFIDTSNPRWKSTLSRDEKCYTEVQEIDWMVTMQNFRLSLSILNTKYKLRNHSLGLLEMEASASFLRQKDITEFSSKIYNDNCYANKDKGLNIIKAFKTENNALGYRFFIKKPQEFLFVGNWNTAKHKELMNLGIWFRTEEKLTEELKKDIAFSHRFVVSTIAENEFFINNNLTGKKNRYQTLLPNKWVKIDDIDNVNNILNEIHFDIIKLERTIWGWLYNKQIDEKGISINCNWLEGEANDYYQIILYNHFQQQDGNGNDNILTYQRTAKTFLKQGKGGAIEELSSNALAKLPFFNKISNPNRYITCLHKLENPEQFLTEDEFYVANWRLYDAYHNNILVLEERIQNYADKVHAETEHNTTKLYNHFIFEFSNVIIPENSEFKLYDSNFNENQVNKILDWCKTKIENKKPSTLLVHYGILERMKGDDNLIKTVTGKKLIKELLSYWVSEGIKVIVTSGRGKHSLDLPDGVCFLNLSSVLYAFVENRNKYSINYIVNQARR